MRTTQSLLLPDPQPLVDRFGKEFFLELPQGPGVYLMKDDGDEVLYVGKAKNLRKRLAYYRVANPDRLPPRLLRLLHTVHQIDILQCRDEAEALAREAELLLRLKPKHNRAGTWKGPSRFLSWSIGANRLLLAVRSTRDSNWHHSPPMGYRAFHLRLALIRLIWCATNPHTGLSSLPLGWFHTDYREQIELPSSPLISDQLVIHIEASMAGNPSPLIDWLRGQIPSSPHAFENLVIENDFEELAKGIR